MNIALSPELVGKIAGIFAFFVLAMPLVQAIIQKPWWSDNVKRGIQFGLSIIGGLLAYFVANGFEVVNIPQLILWILGATAGINVGYSGPVGTIAKGVEAATSKSPYTDAEVESKIDIPKDIPEPDLGEEPPAGFDDGSDPDVAKQAREAKPDEG